MLSFDPGWTVANPPDTANGKMTGSTAEAAGSRAGLTEELLAAAVLLNDFDKTGLQLLD